MISKVAAAVFSLPTIIVSILVVVGDAFEGHWQYSAAGYCSVSILVVVEDTLEVLMEDSGETFIFVSILVVVEDALEDPWRLCDKPHILVSILVVVEDALEEVAKAVSGLPAPCFNPCSDGRCSRIVLDTTAL